MEYKEAVEYINNTAKFGMNLGLQRVKKLLEYMGNPEEKLKCLHIAGTNGKGSVTSMITGILMESGYKVGTYTSPHLERFTERIKVNNEEISEEDVAAMITHIKPLIDRISYEGYGHPTEFEIITAMMFKYFYDSSIDYGVIEVGLGGRLDATNVINPIISVITTISLDHMGVLGDTLSKIAYEKAGIIKENGIAVIYPQEDDVYEVLRSACLEKRASIVDVGIDDITLKSYSMDGQIFDLSVDGELYENLSIKLLGEYQLLNAKTAVTAVKALSMKGIDMSKDSIYKGLKSVAWPGRVEVMSRDPIVLLDGAHNLQGMKSLVCALKKYFKYNKLILVMGVLKDKQYQEMCNEIMPLADSIITTLPLNSRALGAEELENIASSYCSDVHTCPDAYDALRKGIEKTGTADLLLFCGSLYLIGYIRALIQQKGIK